MISFSALLLFPLALSLTSCSGDDDDVVNQDTDPSDDPVIEREPFDISIMYLPDGIGDRASNDLYYDMTLQAASIYAISPAWEHAEIYTHHLIPTDMDDAARLMHDWDNDVYGTGVHCLLILTSNRFEGLLSQNKAWRSDSLRDVLIIDKRNMNDPDLYTLDLPLYGPAWEAGYISAQDSLECKSAIMMANQTDQTLIDAREGWLDGYAAAGGDPQSVPIVETGSYQDETAAANVSDSLFTKCGDQSVNNVVCLLGAAQLGALRELRRKKMYSSLDKLYLNKCLTICEGDYGITYATCTSHTLYRESAVALSLWITNWLEGHMGVADVKENPREQVFTLSDLYGADNSYLYDDTYHLDSLSMLNVEKLAIEAEQKYLTKK